MVMIITNQGKYNFLLSKYYLINMFIEKFIFTAYMYLELSEEVVSLAKKN